MVEIPVAWVIFVMAAIILGCSMVFALSVWWERHQLAKQTRKLYAPTKHSGRD